MDPMDPMDPPPRAGLGIPFAEAPKPAPDGLRPSLSIRRPEAHPFASAPGRPHAEGSEGEEGPGPEGDEAPSRGQGVAARPPGDVVQTLKSGTPLVRERMVTPQPHPPPAFIPRGLLAHHLVAVFRSSLLAFVYNCRRRSMFL